MRRDTDRRLDAGIPERVKRTALADLALHLGRAQRLACPRDEAVAAVAPRLGEKQAEEVVGACARHRPVTVMVGEGWRIYLPVVWHHARPGPGEEATDHRFYLPVVRRHALRPE